MTHHYIYKTTNIINGKFYIGKHSSMLLEDDYLGSGTIITQSIKKYGKENFVREIIMICHTENEAYYYEEQIIASCLGNPMCYNMVPGGKGFNFESAKAACEVAQKNGWYGFKSMSEEDHKSIASGGGKLGAAKCEELNTGMFGWTFDDRSKWSSEINSDRVWITDGTVDMRIKKSDTIPDNFYVGRSIDGFKGRIGMNCWTNGKINIFSFEKPDSDFEIGMIKDTPTAKLPWWNNGIINRRCVEKPGEDFVPGKLSWESKKVTCPRCMKVGGETAMKRHHFDNCRWDNEKEN